MAKTKPAGDEPDDVDANEASEAELGAGLKKVYEDHPGCRDKFVDDDADHVTFETPGGDTDEWEAGTENDEE